MAPAQDVTNALSRIRGVLNPKREAGRATRDIRLGLERIVRVLPHNQEWKGVHVGGTNGKGSICAFLSGLFTLAGVGYGRFVSPAFPDRHNAVTINGRTVNRRMYEREALHVEELYQKLMRGWRFAASDTPGPLSPFELETATAFRIFNKTRVPYGIVEVGMGGSTDATNAMRQKAVTVISKIDLDHQEYLGHTIEEIAKVKAGIMRPGVPCIVDHTNNNSVIKVLRQHASNIGTNISLSWKAEPFLTTLTQERWQLEEYQKQNLLCAALAFRHIFPYKEINLDKLLEMDPRLPGRMEWIGISNLTTNKYSSPVLVDAAHNLLGVQALDRYTSANLRQDGQPITWVMGFSSSKSKPFAEMIETLVRPHDNVAFVEYDQQTNEPPPTPAVIGRDILRRLLKHPDQLYSGDSNIHDAIEWASTKAASGNIAVTGSLYLTRDLYNLDGLYRSRDSANHAPSSSQLWRLSKLWNHRPLTKEEYDDFGLAEDKWRKASENASSVDNGENGATSDRSSRVSNGTKATFDEVAELRRNSAWHMRQLERYNHVLRALNDDFDHETRNGGSLSESLSTLQEDVALIKAQASKHEEEYKKTVERLRNHPGAPRQYALTHSEIFGRPSSRTSTPFMDATELDTPQPTQKSGPTADPPVEGAPEDTAPEEEASVKRDFWGRPEGIDKVPGSGSTSRREQ